MSATTVMFDISGFSFMSIGQKLIYQTNWDTFNNIQTYNSNLSTVAAQTNTVVNYYEFTSYANKNNYKDGQFLHRQRYPNSNWISIDPRYQ
jgi:hypothetical protein